MRKNILILGGRGYIGSALTTYLKERDCHVQDTIPRLYEEIDYNYYKDFDAVILLAGVPSVPRALRLGHAVTFDLNVVSFVDLLSVLDEKQLLIYASSGSVYGRTRDDATEWHPVGRAMNAYDMSKQMIDSYAAVSGRNTIGLRFGTVIGYSDNPRVDLMIPAMMLSSLKSEKITVTNEDNSRALLSMNDLCAGVHAILKHPHPKKGVYNMASVNATIRDIAVAVSKRTETEIEWQPNIEGPSPYSFTLNTDKFQNEFGFEFDGRMSALIDDVYRLDWAAIQANPDKFKRV